MQLSREQEALLFDTSDEDDLAAHSRAAAEECLLVDQLLSSEHFEPDDLLSTDDESDAANLPAPAAAAQRPSSSSSVLSENSLTLVCPSNERQYEGTAHELNPENLGTYVYPVNYEVRDYQRNIVRKALTRNLICALPTGLGKTFIASVVMLNWYRWTKEAKIIFIAPTRPLVSQQVQSFLEISGISINETAALLQSVVDRQNRAEIWNEKRVFFATAQTIENDLRKGAIDPKNIVLLVLDEAHKATGNHSYVNVVKMIKEQTSDFRILALTATPSGKLDGVQTVIENLLISATEIRSEDSLDIRRYVHAREVEKIQIESSPEQDEFLMLINEAVKDFATLLKQARIIPSIDVTSAHSFMIQQQTQSYMRGAAARFNNGRKFQIQAVSGIVAKVVYAVQLLKTHGIVPFYTRMHHLELELMGSNGRNAKSLLQNPAFTAITRKCRKLIYGDDRGPTYSYTDTERRLGFLSHPKIDILRHRVDNFLVHHGADSRIIIFAEFRDSAAEIQWTLRTFNSERVRSTLFVGQASTGKSKIKGMTQKEQQSILTKFKSGDFNVLIATSIGEEGLDIGQVDLIVCYDQSQSPIRNIQRMGRTGRKRDGSIVMLMTKTEASKLAMAFDGHKYIRDQIFESAGSARPGAAPSPFRLSYYPVNRMLPGNIEPRYEEITVETPGENAEAIASGDVLAAMKQRKRRGRAAGRNPGKRARTQPPPVDLETLGFRTAQETFPEP